jgi:hypothetical protein
MRRQRECPTHVRVQIVRLACGKPNPPRMSLQFLPWGLQCRDLPPSADGRTLGNLHWILAARRDFAPCFGFVVGLG